MSTTVLQAHGRRGEKKADPGRCRPAGTTHCRGSGPADSPAYATQLRLITARIIAAANSQAGTDAVRTIRVLAPGAAPAPASQATTPTPKTAAVSLQPLLHGTVSERYRSALAAHQAAAPSRPPADPAIARAVERQAAAMRALSRAAFPVEDTAPEQPAPLDAARHQRRREADATHEAALRRAKAERAARKAGTAAVVSQPAAPIRESA